MQRVKSLKNEWRAGNSAGLASPRSSETSAITCIHGDRNNALYQESITKPEHIKGWGSQVKIFRKDQDESNQQYQMFRWFHAYLRIAEDLKACRGWSRFPSFSPSKPGDPCSVWLPALSAVHANSCIPKTCSPDCPPWQWHGHAWQGLQTWKCHCQPRHTWKAWASRLLSIPRNTKNVTKTPSTPSCMPWTCIHSLLRWSLGSCYLIWAWCGFDAILMHLPLSCNPGAQGSICGGGHTTRCKVYHLSRTGKFFTNRVSMVTSLLHHADICVRLRNRQEAFRSSSPI